MLKACHIDSTRFFKNEINTRRENNRDQGKGAATDTATPIQILILAVIQGITEWLPISSSGHLVIAQKYMGLTLPVLFDIILHIGSLIVVLIVLRKPLLKVLNALVRLDFKSDWGKMAVYVIVGNLATAVIGFVSRDLFESFFDNLLIVGPAFLVTGVFLFISEHDKNHNRPLSYLNALLTGIAQGLALIPGISRSGLTISTGLLRKIDRQTAFTFSFLLFIPAVLGAAVATAAQAPEIATTTVDYLLIILALAVTVSVGYVSLRLLQKILLAAKFHLFAYYCWAIGFFVILTQVLAFS